MKSISMRINEKDALGAVYLAQHLDSFSSINHSSPLDIQHLITHDYIDLTQHFDAFHACYLNNLFIKCLYADHKIYILFVDIEAEGETY